tara:strand:- start:2977 stop:4347 length:1371 start_codon:yes stop_codon:yes gene_type:complete
MKVLHVLANSPPDVNGYAVRTHKILSTVSEDSIGLTSPWYPDRESMVEDYQVDNVKYLRTKHPIHLDKGLTLSLKICQKITRFNHMQKTIKSVSNSRNPEQRKSLLKKIFSAPAYLLKIIWKVLEEKILIKYFTKRIIQVAKQDNVNIIHAHTPYRVGLPALRAARKLKLPFVYEMRGMWEETAVANGRWLRNGPAYRRFQTCETKVLRKADAIICISETLKKEVISRGVESSKITVVTNAVEKTIGEETIHSPIYEQSIKCLKKGDTTMVVGYIGSLRKMEGVEQTAEAVANLISKGYDVRFFVLTGESGQQDLREYCLNLGISDKAVITGPVPHNQVAPFYNLIDIFVVSRPDTRVTRLVTPLKPFEAMAMGKAVVASRLPALQEIITDGETGLLYEADSMISLSTNLEKLIEDNKLLENLGVRAKQWIMANRTWDVVTKKYQLAYSVAKSSAR